MADQIQTETQLIVGAPDNNLRLITAQKYRNFIMSVFGACLPRDPGPTDDAANTSGAGFFDLASSWLNTNVSDQTYWRCFDGTPLAAVWVKMGPGSAATTITGVNGVQVDLVAPSTYVAQLAPMPPAAVYLDHSPAQYLTGGPFLWLPRYPSSWSVSLWYRSTIGIVPGQIIGNADSVTQAWFVKTSGGGIDFGYSSGLSAVQIVTAPAAPPGTWQFLAFGYDSALGEMWLATNGGGKFVAPLTLTPDMSAATIRLNVQYYFGTLQAQNEGDYDCLAIFNDSMSDPETVALYNNGDGLYFKDLPCRLFHACDAFWTFDQPVGPFVDLVRGASLTDTGGSSQDGGICGWRADRPTVLPGGGIFFTGPPWQPTIAVDPHIPSISLIEFVDQVTHPAPPPPTQLELYNVAGSMWFQDSSGIIYLVGANPSSPVWTPYDFDFTDWTGAIGVFPVVTFPPWVCVHALMVSVSQPWTFAGGTTAQVQFAYTNGEEVPTSGTLGGAQIVVSGGTSRPIDTIAILLYNSGPTNNGITIGWDLVLNYSNGVGSATGGHLKLWVLTSVLPH